MDILKRQAAKSFLINSKWSIMTDGVDENNLGRYLKFKRMFPGPYWYPVTQIVELIMHPYVRTPYVVIKTTEEEMDVTGKRNTRIDTSFNNRDMKDSDMSAFYSFAQYMIYDNFVKGKDIRIIDIVADDYEYKKLKEENSGAYIVTYHKSTHSVATKLDVTSVSVIE